MAGETTLTIIGNLTRDPELRFTASGSACATFTVASTPRRYDSNLNEWKDGDALFLRCTAWRQLAEHAAESLTRGARVVVYGRLREHTWDKDGETRSSMELDVEEVAPSLRYATAKVTKMTRSGGGRPAPTDADDPFASGQPSGTGAARSGGGFTDEPPF